jgi:hypothetical protein
MTMLELTTTIMEAAGDPRVKGMIISFNPSIIEHRAVLTGDVVESRLGYAKLDEIQLAIMNFGKEKAIFRLQQAQQKQNTNEASGVGQQGTGDGQQQEQTRSQFYWNQIDLSKDFIIAISDNYSNHNSYSPFLCWRMV